MTMLNDSAGELQSIAHPLRTKLHQYIEATYFIRDPSLVAERRAFLNQTIAIAREPFIETTPSHAITDGYHSLPLPEPIRTQFATFAQWQPGIGIFPHPYQHQAAALTAFFAIAAI